VPETQIIPTLLHQRFPLDQIVLLSDTVSVSPAPIPDSLGSSAPAAVTAWQPGKMTIALTPPAAEAWLQVSENWYPDWTATVDGTPVQTVRGQFSLLTVPVPAGAREVRLEFRSAAFERGRLVSFGALAMTLGLLLGPGLIRRRPPNV
jgi:hypothetical protein